MNLKQKSSIVLATCGVGFIPLAPGTWGSILAVLGYIGYQYLLDSSGMPTNYWVPFTAVILTTFCIIGIKASKIAADAMGEKDPGKIVVDEVMGQWITFAFIPFTLDWRPILIGFILFRAFDILKPFPVDATQELGDGIGICADDIVAGVYAGVLLAVLSLLF
jgi:phosphatidylglycerophosphatase A